MLLCYTAQVIGLSLLWLCYNIWQQTDAHDSSCWMNQQSYWESTHVQQLWVASRTQGRSPVNFYKKNQGPQTRSHKEMKSTNILKSWEMDSCPVKLPNENVVWLMHDCSFVRLWYSRGSSQAISRLLIHGNCEIINVWCFKALYV